MKRAEFKKLCQIKTTLHLAHGMLHEEDSISPETYEEVFPLLDPICDKLSTLLEKYDIEGENNGKG